MPKKVLGEVIKDVNCIKLHALQSLLFSKLYFEIGRYYFKMLLHLEARWFLQKRMLSKLFEQHSNIPLFFIMETNFELRDQLIDNL